MKTINIPITLSGERILRTELYLSMAKLMSMRSTCQRGSNGVIITLDNRIIASGYNNPLPGSADCKELGCDLTQKCQHSVHAEANAIYFAARYGIALQGATLYCTSSPCFNCAQAIVQSGIKTVIYKEDYLTDEGKGLKELTKHNVGVFKK